MNISEVNLQISRIELSVDIDEITINGLNGWPIVRSVLYSLLATKDNKKEKISPLSFTAYQIRRKISINFTKIFLRKRELKKSNLNYDTEIVFLCRASHQVSIKGYVRKFDRVLDPVFSHLKSARHCQMYVLGIPKHKKYFFPKKHLARVGKSPDIRFMGIANSGLEKELLIRKIDLEKFQGLLARAEKDFGEGYDSAKNLFRTNKKMQYIFTSVWYAPETMGYISAAHESGVKVVEVQHAAEIYNHPMYFGWLKTPVGGFGLAPDLFMMWNEKCSEIVRSSFSGGRKNTTSVVGYPWHDFYKLFNKINNPFNNKFQYSKRILFSLQAPTFESKKRIPDFVIEFMKQDRSDVHFNFRCHPNDLNARREIRELDYLDLKTKFEFTDGDEDLVESLTHCNFHVTAYSTVCFEAQIWGIPTLLFGSESAEIYQHEIESGIFQWTEGNADTLEKFLVSEHNMSESRHGLVSSLKLLQEGIDQIIPTKP